MPDPILPDLRESLVRASTRRSRVPLAAAMAALLLTAGVAAATLRGGNDEQPAVDPSSRSVFSLFGRPAGPYDRLPAGSPQARHGTTEVVVRRVVLFGGQVGYASRGGGKICVWAGLGSRCDTERDAERRGVIVGDPSRIITPNGRTVVAGLVPDRVLRVDLKGPSRDRVRGRPAFVDDEVARLRPRNNAFRVNVPGVRDVRSYTLVEAGDADHWSLPPGAKPERRLAPAPMRACPKPYSAGFAWEVDGVPCDAVGAYIGTHFESHLPPHPPPYTLDRGGFACHVPRAKAKYEAYRVTCTDGYRRFAFRFA